MDYVIPVWFEIGSFVVLSLILLADLLLVVKRPHVPSPKESGLWVAFYVALALVFAGMMFAFVGPDAGGEFVAGWLTEYSLSIDNLFVFVIIMAQFAVPKKMQQEVLMVGIILALIFRGVFILLGAALIGAALVVAADFAAAELLGGTNFPVGVVTGVLGAPFLLWLVATGRTRRRSA